MRRYEAMSSRSVIFETQASVDQAGDIKVFAIHASDDTVHRCLSAC